MKIKYYLDKIQFFFTLKSVLLTFSKTRAGVLDYNQIYIYITISKKY
jgi:hypothetical protein